MRLYEKIMQHLDFLESLKEATVALGQATKKEDINLIELITDNRDRLINVIKTFQSGIEEDIAKIKGASVGRELIEILKTWSNEVNEIINYVDTYDKQITSSLEAQKFETSKEIGSVFRNKNSIKNYQSSVVKG